ncbi:MAG: type II secretion system protein [Verrucomicrobia bacterium]|mgnify:CR=1 FL=1|nr:type II secretion system protein [Verrucomicrobiota bacterium]MBT7066996.1 type II secretion system protein [Verrucomicrobiota bacterium]MBT7701812.1 type II secretion system protein [Verrucomicrobiota bacterium]
MSSEQWGVRRSDSAFTLIELLVTVVILSTGIVVILQAFQSSMVALADSRDTMRSAALRHALMVQAELKVRGAGSGAELSDSMLRTRYPEYRWRVDTRADSAPACTNSAWLKHELAIVVEHDMSGREAVAETWVGVREREDRGMDSGGGE